MRELLYYDYLSKGSAAWKKRQTKLCIIWWRCIKSKVPCQNVAHLHIQMTSTYSVPYVLILRCSRSKCILVPSEQQSQTASAQFPPHRPSPMLPSKWGLGGPVVLVQGSVGTSAQILILLPSQMGLENISQRIYVIWKDIVTNFNLFQQSALALFIVSSKTEGHFSTHRENHESCPSQIIQDLKGALCSAIVHSNVIQHMGQIEAATESSNH